MAKGYTKFDNDYFAHLSQLDLNGSELRILLFLLRQSACFKRDYTKECSASYVSEGTGLSIRQVKRAFNILLDKKLIYLDVEHSSKKGHSWFIASDKLGRIKGQTWSFSGDNNVTENIPNMSHKEITVDNREEKKEKREASLHFFPNMDINKYSMDEARAWQEVLSEEDWKAFLEGKVWE